MKLRSKIAITACASIAAIGTTENDIETAYCNQKSSISQNKNRDFVGALSVNSEIELTKIRQENEHYQSLDKSVLMAIFTARKACKMAGWQPNDFFGINIGSSRGATQLFEQHHRFFLENKFTQTLASPSSTLGNIASWVSHDLQQRGPEISHSITCSTALHALINGIAWLQADLTSKFMVGGSEAPLTDFTLAQMKALKIYSREVSNDFPCRSFDLEKKNNTMVIGEGASMLCMEKNPIQKPIGYIESMGFATEVLQHSISISKDALCFQKSMQMALEGLLVSEIDAIVMHAPGTIKGDLSEYESIKKTFGAQLPLLTTNKWLLGHTFGASGMLSVQMALLMLQKQIFIPTPFQNQVPESKKLKKIMVNAVGFGGNAVSIVLGN
jgi:3-oxoacyl-(acyl-carrier-protein) synthase